jgi:uncharacterized surface anchored protein
VIDACDNGDQDVDPTEGAIELDAVPVGEYSAELLPSEGLELVTPLQPVTIEADAVFTLDVGLQPIAVVTPTPTTAAVGFVVVQTTLESDGSPLGNVCLTLTGPETINVCDNDERDFDQTDGTIDLDAVTAGDYTVTIVPPEGFEIAAPVEPLRVVPDELVPLNLTARAAGAGQPTPTEQATGVFFAQVSLEDGTLLGGTCFTLTGTTTLEICDNGEGDVEPTEGVIEHDSVPAGDYDVAVAPPAGYELTSEISAVQIDPDAIAQLAPVLRATQEATTEAATGTPTETVEVSPTETPTEPVAPAPGAIVIRAIDAETGEPLPAGACYDAVGPEGATASGCDDQGTGEVRLTDLTPGTWTVVQSVTPEGYEPGVEQTVEVGAGAEAPIEIRNAKTVQAPGSIAARAIDQDGNPISSGCYVAYGPEGATASACDDNGDGVANLGELVVGEWTVIEVESPPGHESAQQPELPGTVASDQQTEVVFTNIRSDPATAALPPPLPVPTAAIATGDFQDELGCPTDFDPECDVTQLKENRGIWSGVLVIPQGSYALRILARSDVDRSLGDGGNPDANDRRFVVPDGATAVYIAYDPSIGEIDVRPSKNHFQFATQDGTFDMKPLEDGQFEAFVDLTAGPKDFQVLADGQPVYQESTSLDQDARLHIVVDSSGNPAVFEVIVPASLSITKVDANGNISPGSCFAVLSSAGDLAGQACDVDGSGGVIVRFPNGVAPGDYLIRETATAEGGAPAPIQTVNLSGGDDQVQVAG